MKIKCFIIITILFTNLIATSQTRFTDKELKEFRKRVLETRKLGRAGIIAVAAKAVSDNPISLINEKDVIISVWYNHIEVKVEFIQRSLLLYIPRGSRYATKMEVHVSLDKAFQSDY